MHKSLRWFIVFSRMPQFSDQTTTSNWSYGRLFLGQLSSTSRKSERIYRLLSTRLCSTMEQIVPRCHARRRASSFLKNCDKSTVAVPPILMEMQDKRPVSPVPPYGGGLFLIYPPANCTKKRVVFYLVRERETVCLAAKLQDGLFLIQAWLFCCNRAQRTRPTEI